MHKRGLASQRLVTRKHAFIPKWGRLVPEYSSSLWSFPNNAFKPTILPMTFLNARLLPVGIIAATAFATYAQGPGGPRKPWKNLQIDATKLPRAAAQQGVTFEKDIRPIFEASCFNCHGEEKQKADLRVDSLEAVLKGGEDGKVVILGDSAKSLLVIAVSGLDPEHAMPPKRRPGGPGGRPPGGGAGFGGQQPPDSPGGADAANTNRPRGDRPPGPGFGGPGGGPGGPPAKNLTPEQVALVRAWIDQGAK